MIFDYEDDDNVYKDTDISDDVIHYLVSVDGVVHRAQLGHYDADERKFYMDVTGRYIFVHITYDPSKGEYGLSSDDMSKIRDNSLMFECDDRSCNITFICHIDILD